MSMGIFFMFELFLGSEHSKKKKHEQVSPSAPITQTSRQHHYLVNAARMDFAMTCKLSVLYLVVEGQWEGG